MIITRVLGTYASMSCFYCFTKTFLKVLKIRHILSNVGRVVARDSSRTTAHSSDLYTALCEDESLYPLFKTMKGVLFSLLKRFVILIKF